MGPVAAAEEQSTSRKVALFAGRTSAQAARPAAPPVRVAPLAVATAAPSPSDSVRARALEAGLAAQQVEYLCRRRRDADLPVLFGTELHVALDAGRRMFRPLPFIAMRKKHHNPAWPLPL